MNRLKKLSAALACVMALTVFAAGCSDSSGDENEQVTPNVITSAGGEEGSSAENGEVTTASDASEAPAVSDNGGNADVTGSADAAGSVTEATAPAETMSPEDIQAAVTASVTQATAVVDNTVDSTTKYAYNTLDANEKALYDAIVDAAEKVQSRLRVTDAVTLEIWAKIFGMVYNQEPQLFWLNKKISVGRLYYNETDPDKIASMQKEIDASADKLISEASGKSTYEKLKIFHDYLVLNSTFEKADDIGSYNETIYNAFKNGTSAQGDIQCSGYAKSMLYLCDKAGIDCMVIVGTNEEGLSHAWNKVKVEGEWYNLDCTWDDPILSTPIHNYLRYNNFLVPDEWINQKTHYNINLKKLNTGDEFVYFDPPKATADAQNYFKKNGYVYNDADSAEAAIKKELDSAAADGRSVAEIMVGSKDVYDTIKSRLKSYQDELNSKYSNVKGIADNCNEHMLIIQVDVKYK